MDIRLSSQKGRSMLEMLSIVLIIALLTISALLGLSRLVNKTRANRIIHDGQLVYMDAVSDTENLIKNKNNWMTPSTITESGNPFFYMVDVIGNPYVKVEGIQKETCVLLLDMQSDELKFYTTENEEFTTCQENDNALVIDYTGTGLPRECSGYSDCEGAGDTTFCSAQGQCGTCDGGHVHNESGQGCECFDGNDPEKEAELTCSDAQGNTWCCGRNEEYELTICGSKKGECIRSKGTCNYEMTQMTSKTIKSADCRYRMTPVTSKSTKSADCSYTITITSSSVNFKEENGCDSSKNEYCYLAYSESDCSKGLTTDASGIIYGVCIPQTSTSSQCRTTQTETSGGLTEILGCDSSKNEYCYLAYSESDCSKGLTTDASGTIYGVCISQTSTSSQCRTTQTETTGGLTENVGCPARQYCYIKWKKEDCSEGVSTDSYGTLYGACIPQIGNSATCPITTD